MATRLTYPAGALPAPPGPGAAALAAAPRPLVSLLVFGLPFLMLIEVNAIGRLFLAEIAILLLLPWLLILRERLLHARLPRAFLCLGLVWLGSQVVTDLVVGAPFTDYSRGWAKISFFLADFSTLYLLLHGDGRRLCLFAAGMGVSALFAYVVAAGAVPGGAWKFCLGPACSLLAVLAAQSPPLARRCGLQTALLLAMAFLNIVLGCRSLGLICYLTAAYLLLQRQARRWRRPAAAALVAALLVLASAAGFRYLHGWALELSGPEAIEKQLAQSGRYGVLLGGRPEAYVAVQAIRDSPLLGHGSWAKDPQYALLLYDLQRYGYKFNPAKLVDVGLIPTHSHLFGAWVEAGLVGGLFWLAVLVLCLLLLVRARGTPHPLGPLLAYVSFLTLWGVLYSPFGAEMRFVDAYFLVLLVGFHQGRQARRAEGS
jgi:hypothetical protein